MERRARHCREDDLLVDADQLSWITDPLMREVTSLVADRPEANRYEELKRYTFMLGEEEEVALILLDTAAEFTACVVEPDEDTYDSTGLDMPAIADIDEVLPCVVAAGESPELAPLLIDDEGRLYTQSYDHSVGFIDHPLLHPAQPDADLVDRFRRFMSTLPMHRRIASQLIPTTVVIDTIAPLAAAVTARSTSHSLQEYVFDLEEAIDITEIHTEGYIELARTVADLLRPLVKNQTQARSFGLDHAALVSWHTALTQARTPPGTPAGRSCCSTHNSNAGV